MAGYLKEYLKEEWLCLNACKMVSFTANWPGPSVLSNILFSVFEVCLRG